MEYTSQVPTKRRFYVMVENFRYGPYTLETLQLYISSGEISRNCQVCEEGSNLWIPLSSMVEFQHAPVKAPPPPPTPVAINTRQLRKQMRELSNIPRSQAVPVGPVRKQASKQSFAARLRRFLKGE
ncbi:DUF4339 domain-containing protein [bacterium]|nr:DUF4339 domain-containing protein [candidate division CSSED10-310 bacterium]